MNGIVYKVYNLINGKMYIGQTIKTLEKRKSKHYHAIKEKCKENNHFLRALKKYKKEDFVWSVLAEVPYEYLNEVEIFYIDYYKTFEYGYNSTTGGDSCLGTKFRNVDKTIYTLYHKQHGVVKGIQSELKRNYSICDKHFSALLKEKRLSVNGWVLEKNKDYYDDIINSKGVNLLREERFKQKIINNNKIHFYNEAIGHEYLTRKEMYLKYKLTSNSLSNLIKGKQKIHKGWIIIKDNLEY